MYKFQSLRQCYLGINRELSLGFRVLFISGWFNELYLCVQAIHMIQHAYDPESNSLNCCTLAAVATTNKSRKSSRNGQPRRMAMLLSEGSKSEVKEDGVKVRV